MDSTIRNIFACLVHENQACVIDLVRNLRCLDPSSLILIYNGGRDPELLGRSFPFERYGVVLHPSPRPLQWGRLHDFALDCMRFALDHFSFDTLTVVDSDQLALQPNYSGALAGFLQGRSGIGMLGNAPQRQPATTQVAPAKTAHEEIELWRPFLRKFERGEAKYVHWTFWPSTVFTADAARDLTRLFDSSQELQDIMRRTRIWASEEVILPTLVALLGYRITLNPCSYDYVKYRVPYSLKELSTAVARPDVYWMHPVPREERDELRVNIAKSFKYYRKSVDQPKPYRRPVMGAESNLMLTLPILNQMRMIEGWLEDGEADLLISATARALRDLPAASTIVEVGSYCGRSTVGIGMAAKFTRTEARVYAIDPHNGEVGAADQGIQLAPTTLLKFQRNIEQAGLSDHVHLIRQRSYEVSWEKPISLLFIDGLHDYANVSRDFFHFEKWIVPGGYVAFHDYADYYPGVQVFVDEVLAGGGFSKVQLVGSMMLVRKQPTVEAPAKGYSALPQGTGLGEPLPSSGALLDSRALSSIGPSDGPLVSCIMPTFDRRAFVPRAIEYFMRQDYSNRELVVVDDGTDPVVDLIPVDQRIRYIRLDGRRSVGAKRNLACQEAKGEIIVHWDDDDWMASSRLGYQVKSLIAAQADICGLDNILFYEPTHQQAWKYVFPQGRQTWVYGGTLCYTKAIWRQQPFLDLNIGEDTRFVLNGDAKSVAALQDNRFYIALIHPGNTCPKHTSDRRWRAYPAQQIQEMLGDDLDFYASLPHSTVAGH